MINTMNSNTQTTRQLLVEQQKTVLLLNSKNQQLKNFKDKRCDLVKHRVNWNALVQDDKNTDQERELYRKLQQHNELKIQIFDSIIQKNLREALQTTKDASKLLDDFLTEIIFSDIKTGLLVTYADLTKENHELTRLELKYFFETLGNLQKLGQPRYWN